MSLIITEDEQATCIGCGCSDFAPCESRCFWLEVDREHGIGVCSECPEYLDAFATGLPALP